MSSRVRINSEVQKWNIVSLFLNFSVDETKVKVKNSMDMSSDMFL